MSTSNIAQHIVAWINNYSNENGFSNLVVGVSGGIDSAVTACLSAHTGLKTYLISLPILQNQAEIARAEKHCKALSEKHTNVESLVYDLTEVFQKFASITNQPNHPQNALALANTRSRLRMTALYYHAQLNSALVVGTGNKIEDFGIGFFTKYGDGGVDISPIADLNKSEVYALGREFGVHHGILSAAPTDGLWDDSRCDEDQIGATYAELERAMRHQPSSHIDMTERDKEVLDIYQKLHLRNRHKTQPIPVCKIPSSIRN